MKRSFDYVKIAEILSDYPELINDSFSLIDWLKCEGNVALVEGDSLAMFYKDVEGRYVGHYFFNREHRGKGAIKLAKSMLAEMFNKYSARLIIGLTPIENKAALWMNRQLGFKDYGEVVIQEGHPVRLVILSKDEFNG